MADAFQLGNARAIRKNGSSLRDAQGRIVLLRGFNFGARSKSPPFLPVMSLDVSTLDTARFLSELEAITPKLDFMRQIGVSAVRLLVIWKALEASPGDPEQLQPDAVSYLQMLRAVMDALYARDIYVFLDFHQDIAQERFGGDGFPDWAMSVDRSGLPRPAGFQNSSWGLLYFDLSSTDPRYSLLTQAAQAIFLRYNRFVRGTLFSFWTNSLNNYPNLSNFPVRTHLEKTIGQVAKFFMDHPGVLGYELFNEPIPVGLGNSNFETTILPQYYTNAINEISRFDSTALIFVEPRVTWNVFPPDIEEFGWQTFASTPVTALNSAALPAQERLIFSFHYYDPNLSSPLENLNWNMSGQARDWPAFFAAMVAEGKKRNMVPFMTEFGGQWSWQSKDPGINPDLYQFRALRAVIDLSFKQIEAQFLHATYWHFDLYNSESDGDRWNQENFSSLGPDRVLRNWDLFARPYPLRSAAAPQLLWFDAQTRNFVLILNGPPVSAATVLHIPQALQYSTGFEVRATSAGLQWDEARQLLAWSANPSQTFHAIAICPPGGLNSGSLPDAARNALSAMPFFVVIQPALSVLADTTIDVPEKSSGVDTGIDIGPGSYFEFQASGSLWAGVWMTGENGPAGWNTIDTNSKFPLHSGLHAYPFSLIGRFGQDGDYFYIGKGLPRTKFTGNSPKRIYLRTNDDSPGNGRGSFSCRVLVSQDAAPPHNAIFVRQDMPAQMRPGSTCQVSVTMRNVSGPTWVSPCRLGSQSPQDSVIWGLGRVDLPGSVPAGNEVLFQFTVTAPSKPGKYLFQWQMVEDGVAWFGPVTPAIAVNVGTTHKPSDYDGDGRTDLVVWRPSEGNWYVIPSSTGTPQARRQWGAQGDIPVPGDYDGDGKTDFAVWRPSEGNWYVITSSTGMPQAQPQWGAPGDVPVPGDYDGDGKTDLAVWRPSEGKWYVIPSSTGRPLAARQWGASGDIPVPGDYDGDGKTDLAVWRPSEGNWYVIPSSTGTPQPQRQWGASGDIPVPGDYDGDGRTDLAVWRPSEGNWYVIPSSTGTPQVRQWGAAGDIPVPGDYDGDGKTDFAVWRPSEGNWYIIPSSTGTPHVPRQWGLPGDVPA